MMGNQKNILTVPLSRPICGAVFLYCNSCENPLSIKKSPYILRPCSILVLRGNCLAGMQGREVQENIQGGRRKPWAGRKAKSISSRRGVS